MDIVRGFMPIRTGYHHRDGIVAADRNHGAELRNHARPRAREIKFNTHAV
jgi:hypothetical protein